MGSQISANCPKFTRLFFGGLPLGPEMIMFVLNFEDQGGTVESQRKVFVRFTTFVKFASAAVPIHSYTAPKISLVKLAVDDNWSLMQILCVCQGWVVGLGGGTKALYFCTYLPLQSVFMCLPEGRPRLFAFVHLFLLNQNHRI